MAHHDNSRWRTVANGVVALAKDYPRHALFAARHAYTRDDWLGLVAVSADTAEDEDFFGTRTLNLVVLSRTLDPTGGDEYAAQRDRLVAHYARFSAYRTLVYIDTGTLLGVDPGLEVGSFERTIRGVCDDLADVGFVYGGRVDYDATFADDFRPAIEEFFDLST